jgi:tRNA A37 N6-isopentenylltransferase MiaA
MLYGVKPPSNILLRGNTFQRFSFETVVVQDENEPIEKHINLEVPQLFKKPKLEEIKNLVQSYYIQKKLL